LELRQRLLRSLLGENPFQPATSWWRAIELAVLIRHGLPPGRGLDLGCGDGKLMRILLDAAGARLRLVGADIDALETRDAAASGIYEQVYTVPGERLPEPDGSFDFVLSNSVLEHIEGLEPVIAEMARVLRPGGVFLFTVPAAGFHDCLAGPLWGDRDLYLRNIDRRCAHYRYWDEAQWRACLGGHGFDVSRGLPYLSRAEVQRWETLSRLTAGALDVLVRGRMRPIEIQRALGVRRRGLRLPAWAAAPLAAAVAAGMPASAAAEGAGVCGCLLIEARRHP
jgi:SAM-dependent methyltransferase